MTRAHLLVLAFLGGCASAAPANLRTPTVCTFSIVARDPATGELGVAVASKFIAVGAVVPWGRGGVGAVATQAWANTAFGPRGLALLDAGTAPEEAIARLLRDDEHAAHRQVALIDTAGRVSAYTGEKCLPFAGHRTGESYSVQGNLLAGEGVLAAMGEAYERAEGDLAQRLLAALSAGDAAGGDKRGRQSAALLIIREGWGYSGYNDRYRDLRVDDHERPIEELRRLYDLHLTVFPRPE